MPKTAVSQQDELIHRKYLYKLKKSVDLWFLVKRDQADAGADTLDCFLQINSAIKLILLDGFYSKDAKDFAITISEFIENLDWLHPGIKNHASHAKAMRVVEKSTLCDDIFVWINENLENAQLCDKLKLLISDSDVVNKYYNQHAYLRNEIYSLAFLICLSAIEENQSNLLSRIDTSLYAKHSFSSEHNRTSENPNTQQVDVKVTKRWQSLPNLTQKNVANTSNDDVTSKSDSRRTEIDSPGTTVPENKRFANESPDLKPIQLVRCDDIEIHVDQRLRACHNEHITQSPAIMESNSSPSIQTANHINLFSCIMANALSSSDDEESKGNVNKSYYLNFPSTSSDFASVFLPREGEKLQHRCCRNSLFDNFDGNPTPGVGKSFETSLTQNSTDLERENAHFDISEDMIAEIERIKWLNAEAKRTNTRRKLLANRRSKSGKCRRNISDGAISNESYGNSNMSDSSESERSDCCSDNKSHDQLNLGDKMTHSSGLSINEHKAFAEWGESRMETLSAEGVALSLLSKFSDVELPSNLTWLIPKQDESRDIHEIRRKTHNRKDHTNHPLTRGTNDWAPPRPQIIFTLHGPHDRKTFMEKQNFRCAGCGIKICPNYMHRYRYCYYFGKYHCSGCHRNQISTIPAKVLYQWDFTRYPVSIFAYRLLEEIWRYPLFNVADLNKEMYTKVKKLEVVRMQRIQLKFMKGFIASCRFAEEERLLLENTRSYLLDDPDMWTMSDFETTRDATLHVYLADLIKKFEGHIYNCMLCTARGFVCEVCPKKQLIFPWQKKVVKCEQCGSCYHEACWNSSHECLKCLRLSRRLKY